MKYPGYPEYGDPVTATGVLFPKDWRVERLRFSIQSNPVKSEIKDRNPDEPVTFVPMEAVGEYGGIDTTQEKPLSDVYSGYTYFAENDILVAKITPCFENGKGAIANGLKNSIGFGTTEFHVLRPLEGISARWLFYLTLSDSFRGLGTTEMLGAGGQKRVPENFIRDFRTGIPSLSEQDQIADFLDYKTAQIDALIAKKQELIEKLKEQRIAVVSQAVTKGLDPNAPMRESGVDWLGQVPEHWSVKRAKFVVTKIGSGKTPSGGATVYVDSGVMLLRSQNIHDEGLRLDDVVYMTEEADELQSTSRVQARDVLLNITGASIGRASIVPAQIPPTNVNQHVCILRPILSEVVPEYLHLLLCSKLAKEQIFSNENGTSREGLNFQQVGDLIFAFPNIPTQTNILHFCEIISAKLYALTSQTQRVIDRLTEYRTALITAATTGKIDVRKVRFG